LEVFYFTFKHINNYNVLKQEYMKVFYSHISSSNNSKIWVKFNNVLQKCVRVWSLHLLLWMTEVSIYNNMPCNLSGNYNLIMLVTLSLKNMQLYYEITTQGGYNEHKIGVSSLFLPILDLNIFQINMYVGVLYSNSGWKMLVSTGPTRKLACE